jgi:hypothetical protein
MTDASASATQGPAGATAMNFGAVDLDVWARQFLAAFDLYMSPPYASAIYALAAAGAADGPAGALDRAGPSRARMGGQALFEQLVAVKQQLADRIALGLIPVLVGPTGPTGPAGPVTPASALGDAREMLRQQALVSLSSAYADSVVVQPRFNVGADLAARLVGQPVDLGAGSARRGMGATGPTGPNGTSYTMSTAKLPVAGGPTDLSFILDVRSPPDQSEASFDLGFVINQMEIDITAVPGVSGYQASTWLNFVRPLGLTGCTGGVEVNTDVGPFAAPIPLRAYPTPPTMTDQSAKESYPGATDLALARQWDLAFSFDYAPAAQDSLFPSVDFNLGGQRAAAPAAHGPDLFDCLAEFVTIYPDLAAALSTLPAAQPDPSALPAVERFLDISTKIAQSWSVYAPDPPSGQTTGNCAAYEFDLQWKQGAAEPTLTGILVSVSATPRFDTPAWPVISLAPERAAAVTLTSPANPPPAVAGASALYAAPAPGIPLVGAASFAILLPGLDAVHLFDAWGAVSVQRNRVLIKKRTTDQHFIYQTPLVRFKNGIAPSIVQQGPFDVAAIVGAGGPQPLAAWLSGLLHKVLEVPEEGPTIPGLSRIIVECSYGFDLLPGEPRTGGFEVVTPARLQPPFDVMLADLASSGVTGFACEFARSVLEWASHRAPASQAGGRLSLAIDLMPSSGGDNAPSAAIISLKNMRLDVSLISDFPAGTTARGENE